MSSKRIVTCDVCKERVEVDGESRDPDGWVVIDISHDDSVMGTFDACQRCFVSETGVLWNLADTGEMPAAEVPGKPETAKSRVFAYSTTEPKRQIVLEISENVCDDLAALLTRRIYELEKVSRIGDEKELAEEFVKFYTSFRDLLAIG